MQIILQIYKLLIRCVFFAFFLLIKPTFSQQINDSWTVIRQQFSLNHELHRPEVQAQIRWLVSHPKYLHKLSQAEPYIYHIMSEIEKRHLPGEIALIPMLESAYNPLAYSGAGAAGLWQLMPQTGKDLGVKGDWWIDGRRHIGSSTTAALNYFQYLSRFFHGNWLLAIAAYDYGEGNVKRKLSNVSATQQNFWALPMPQETQIYVPRLLALSEIIAHPEHYGIKLPYIPHQPYFEEIHVNKQLDLNQAAKLAGMNFKDFLKLNPGFNHWKTSPNVPAKLLIPKRHVALFSSNLAKLTDIPKASLIKHQVQHGETINSIAYHYHITPQQLLQANQLKYNILTLGQQLNIPGQTKLPQLTVYTPHKPIPKTAANTELIAPKTYKIIHIVQNNEQLTQLSQKYKISSMDIIRWNNLQTHGLKSGQKLIIWRQTNGTPFYTVKQGDTFLKIAEINHLPVDILKHLNPNINAQLLQPGQKIRVV
jgi:membrane-bound lytic murein transglycosylase D